MPKDRSIVKENLLSMAQQGLEPEDLEDYIRAEGYSPDEFISVDAEPVQKQSIVGMTMPEAIATIRNVGAENIEEATPEQIQEELKTGAKRALGTVATLGSFHPAIAAGAVPLQIGKFAGLMAAEKLAEGFVDGKSLGRNIMDSAKEARNTAILDAATRGAFAGVSKGYKAIRPTLYNIAEPIRKADEVAEALIAKGKEKIGLDRAINELTNKVSGIGQELSSRKALIEDNLTSALSEISEQGRSIAQRQQQELSTRQSDLLKITEKQRAATDDFAARLGTIAKTARLKMTKHYDDFYEQFGGKQVDISTQLDGLAEIAGGGQVVDVGKNLKTTLANLYPNMDAGDAKTLENILGSIQTSGSTVKDSDKLRRWLVEQSIKLRGGSTSELSLQLGRVAEDLQEAINSQTGGKLYQTLSTNYKDLLALEDESKRFLGSTNLQTGTPRNVYSAIQRFKKALLSGDQDAVEKLNREGFVGYIKNSSKYLRRIGFSAKAKKLEDSIVNLSESYTNEKGIVDTIASIEKGLGKDATKELVDEAKNAFALKQQQAALPYRMQTEEATREINKMKNDRFAIAKHIEELKLQNPRQSFDDALSLVGFGVVTDGLATLSGLAPVKIVAKALVAGYGLKKYSPVGANIAIKAADKIERILEKNKNITSKVKRASLIGLNYLRRKIEEENDSYESVNQGL